MPRCTRRYAVMSGYAVLLLGMVVLHSLRSVSTIHQMTMGTEIEKHTGTESRNSVSDVFTGPVDEEVYIANFRRSGGLFVFLHIPKTGGSAVREFLRSQSLPWEQKTKTNSSLPLFFSATNLKRWKEFERWVKNDGIATLKGRSVFVEAHLQPRPMHLLAKISTWKQFGPVFAFSIVREPATHALSWFR